jgi:hypothetical protein
VRRRAAAPVQAPAAAALAGGAAAARAAPEPDLIVVARAFTAAWNAHDVEAVVALFAPDAEVREPRAALATAGPDAAAGPDARASDPFGTQRYLAGRPLAVDEDGTVAWAAGRAELRAWAQDVLARGARTSATGYAAAGEEVTWAFAMALDPLPRVGVAEPLAGTATARLRGGRIASLLLVADGASVQRREAASTAALLATATAAHAGGADGRPGRAPAPRAAGEAPAGAWPLALGGLGALAALTFGLRRRAPRR